MFSSLTRKFLALLFAPLFALCLVTATGCEEEAEIGGDNGIEVEDGDVGDGELEVEGE